MCIRDRFNSGMKVEDILNKHVGKILYIDKWNTFFGEERYNEIVSDLIKFIDNNSNRIVIVLGGIRGKMKDLILTNEGLNYSCLLYTSSYPSF